MNKDLISGFDLSAADINAIFSQTKKLKKKKISAVLKGKTVGLVFQKPSVRTRVSFEVGARQLGADCLYLAPGDIQLGAREPIKDIARVLSRYLDGIVARTFSHTHILEMAAYSKVSIINGLSDLYHPAQGLADIYTIIEKAGKCKGKKLVFIGDGNNVVHSLVALSAKVGLHFSLATPKGYEPNKQIWLEALKIAKKTGTKILHTYDAKEALKGADFVYTDVWTSMGQEQERKKFSDLINKHLDLKRFTAVIRDAMVKTFTAEELQALANFYGSPVGKSAMKKTGQYMSDAMPQIQALMKEAIQKAKAEMEK